MRLLCILLSFLTLSQCKRLDPLQDPLADEYIERIQNLATTWKAGRNFHRRTSMKHLQRLMGFVPLRHSNSDKHGTYSQPEAMPEGFELPENFDAREKWPFCPSIKEVTDQGGCGSCWAISSVEVMTDRTCLLSGGKDNFHYSTEDLMSCCSGCGNGCNGGDPSMAFGYWLSHGIVSGGEYNSSQGCVPYQIPPCEHHVNGTRPQCESENFDTPTCKNRCDNSYPVAYKKDLRKGAKMYDLSHARNAMQDLVNNGPISACFAVFSDILSYKSGVYQRTPHSSYLGGHAIRIIGYGTENGVPYWLCANSWNADWGDKGHFKILRGKNECGIEDNLLAGIPKV